MTIQSIPTDRARGTRNTAPRDSARSFEDFVYLLSHDVHNSVRALVEVPKWIEEDLAEDGHRIEGSLAENLAMMRTHTDRLDRMLADLLVYSRVGRRQKVVQIDVPHAVAQAVNEFRPLPEYRIRQRVQEMTLRIGERDMMTLLSELISNAMKHHDRNEGEIRISAGMAGGARIISVLDDGPGIPEKDRDKVMEPMVTLRPRDQVEGSGMGLAIARKIVEFYGGTLCIDSGPDGQGTCVEMRFPAI